jgi:hypothetical protein
MREHDLDPAQLGRADGDPRAADALAVGGGDREADGLGGLREQDAGAGVGMRGRLCGRGRGGKRDGYGLTDVDRGDARRSRRGRLSRWRGLLRCSGAGRRGGGTVGSLIGRVALRVPGR